MQAGLLTERIIIEKPITQQNGFGANAIKWTEFVTTRAGVTYSNGNRANENNEIVYIYTVVFKIRYYHKVTEFMRITWNDQKYRILSIQADKHKLYKLINAELIND